MTDGPDPTPGGPGEPEPAPLSPEDEAAVHDLLAALPDPELPPDVARRITSALGAVPGGLGPVGAPTATVLAARPPSGRWRQPRLLQAAAALVVVALIGAATIGVITRGGNGGGDTPTVTGASTTGGAGPITVSSADYTAATLPTQVVALLAGATGAAPQAAPQSGAQPGTTAPRTTANLHAVTALIENPVRRQACIDQLAGTPGVHQVAIDIGAWNDKPAAIIVLPDANNPDEVDVWVVGQTCSDADNPFPYDYAQVTRP